MWATRQGRLHISSNMTQPAKWLQVFAVSRHWTPTTASSAADRIPMTKMTTAEVLLQALRQQCRNACEKVGAKSEHRVSSSALTLDIVTSD